MNQLQQRQVVYVEEEQPQYEVVYVQRKPRLSLEARRARIEMLMILPFLLGVMALVVASFVVDDVSGLVKRAAGAIVILFLAGGAGVVITGIWFGVRDFFRGDWL